MKGSVFEWLGQQANKSTTGQSSQINEVGPDLYTHRKPKDALAYKSRPQQSTTGRQSSILPTPVERAYSGSLGFQCHLGLQDSFHASPTSNTATSFSCQPGGDHSIILGDSITVGKRSHSKGNMKKLVHKQHFSGTKRWWQIQAHTQSEGSKPVHFVRTFQDGGCSLCEGPSQPGELSMQAGPEECLPFTSNSQELKKYFQFRWQGVLYEYSAPPFGLSTAPRVFTKVLKPALAKLRLMGIRLVAYLDDLLIIGRTKREAEVAFTQAKDILEHLGFIINQEKSQNQASQVIEFLGFLINSREMSSKGVQSAHETDGPMRDRPVCISVDGTAADLHELALGPRSSGHRCSVPTMELCTGLCLPSICSHQEMPEQGPLGRSTRAGVGHTNLANSNVVFNAGMDVHRKTHPDSNNKTVVEKPQGREPPFNQPRVTESSHMASIQRSLVAEGISEEAAKLFLSSWR